MILSKEKRKVGTRVLVSEPYGFHERRHWPGTIARVTPSGCTTVMVDACPQRYQIQHEKNFTAKGWMVGTGVYSGYEICEFSASILTDEARRDALLEARHFLEDRDTWRKLSDDLLLRIYALVKPITTKPTENVLNLLAPCLKGH